MTIEGNHNHFCIYCGAKLSEGQNFCTYCGKAVFHETPVNVVSSKYSSRIDELEKEYDVKQSKAREMVAKLFDPSHMAYGKFSGSITKSNQLFSNQVKIARKMVELGDSGNNGYVEQELESKLRTLQDFIDKMEDLTNELVIHLSSNKEDTEDINNLFNDMDDLINSVKDY